MTLDVVEAVLDPDGTVWVGWYADGQYRWLKLQEGAA
jgi:hypothetical protein